MNQNLINIIVAYCIGINLLAIVIIFLQAKTELIKIPKGIVNLILTMFSLIGGFVGVLVGAEILSYEQDNKLFKRWIPLFIFIEVCIVIYIIYQNI